MECSSIGCNLCVKFEQILRPLIFRPYVLWRLKLIDRALACALRERAQISQGIFQTKKATYKSWRGVALNFFAIWDRLLQSDSTVTLTSLRSILRGHSFYINQWQSLKSQVLRARPPHQRRPLTVIFAAAAKSPQ